MMKVAIDISSKLQNQFLEECGRLQIVPTDHNLVVDIPSRKLYHYYEGGLARVYKVSTSEKEPSCIKDSFGTPWGMHEIAEKIGDEAELGMVFKARKPIGKKYWECDEHLKGERLITTRILWLRGLEVGLNQGEGRDSYNRYIYIHGTNREDLLGSWATLGCITMGNEDITDLYDLIPCASLVWIKI